MQKRNELLETRTLSNKLAPKTVCANKYLVCANVCKNRKKHHDNGTNGTHTTKSLKRGISYRTSTNSITIAMARSNLEVK